MRHTSGGGRVGGFLNAILKEPPLRMLSRAVVKRLPTSVRTQALWDTAPRPQYLAGIMAAADQAKRESIEAISAFEFGVAGGNGLMALAQSAIQVETETGITIKVYGFDAGSGLPELCGDYRDLPDQWRPGDYPMDELALRASLPANTTLIVGNITDTLPHHMPHIKAPIGFVAVDVDLYSSTRTLLQMFTLGGAKMLMHVPMYFDDVDLFQVHRFAGEILAIEEFNASQDRVKIDGWRGIEKHRPFHDAHWLKKMYVAHDVDSISKFRLARAPANLALA
jgi:hypothetical protein